MKKIIYLLLIVFSIFIKAEDNLTIEKFKKIYSSQSLICQNLTGLRMMTYCFLNIEPFNIEYCIEYAFFHDTMSDTKLEVQNTETEEAQNVIRALDRKVESVCTERIPDLFFKEHTPPDQKKTMIVPFIHCVQPLINQVEKEDYKCHNFDYLQVLETTMPHIPYITKEDRDKVECGSH